MRAFHYIGDLFHLGDSRPRDLPLRYPTAPPLDGLYSHLLDFQPRCLPDKIVVPPDNVA